MFAFGRIVSMVLLPGLIIGLLGGSAKQVVRYSIPISVTVDGVESSFDLVVDVGPEGVSPSVPQPTAGVAVQIGEVEYLGKVTAIDETDFVTSSHALPADLGDLKAGATDVSFDDMARNNKSLVGDLVHFIGQVDSVSNSFKQSPRELQFEQRTLATDGTGRKQSG